MIRFLIDQFRNAPGPLKTPRILIADLADEVLDLTKHYLKRDDNSSTYPCCNDSSTSVPSPSPQPASQPAPVQQTSVPKDDPAPNADIPPAPEAESTSSNSSSNIDPSLAKAISEPGNVRKQAFKVLAILWDAHSKNMGALSAKAISKHGDKNLNLQIRHENVRKVIRMRLENFVNVHAQGVGNGTVYNYELSDAGLNFFVTTYFN